MSLASLANRTDNRSDGEREIPLRADVWPATLSLRSDGDGRADGPQEALVRRGREILPQKFHRLCVQDQGDYHHRGGSLGHPLPDGGGRGQ